MLLEIRSQQKATLTFSADVSVLGYYFIRYPAVTLNYTLLGQGCAH